MAKIICARNLFAYQEIFADYVLPTITTTPSQDLSEEARSPDVGDVPVQGIAGLGIYLGFKDFRPHSLHFILSEVAAAGTRDWKYSTGVGAFSTFVNDPYFLRGNKNFTGSSYIVDAIWEPADVTGWIRTTVHGKHAFWIYLVTATGDNSFTASQISVRNILASSEELVLPAMNLGGTSPSDAWKTRHETIEIKSGQNDYLSFDFGAGESVMVLENAVYRATDIASYIESYFGSGVIYCEWDPILGFSFNGDANYTMKCASATAKSRSAWPMLGFYATADRSLVAGTPQRSNYPKKSSGPTYTITAATKNFKFTDTAARDINLTEGTFNTAGLQAMVSAEMSASGGGFNYDLAFDEESLIFSIRKNTGTVAIDSGGTFPSVIGFPSSAAAADVQYGSAQRVGTGEWIVLIYHSTDDVVSAHDITDVLMLNCNFQDDATITVAEYSGAGVWGTEEAFFYDAELGIAYRKFTGATSNMWRISMTDIDNPDGYLQAGLAAVFEDDNEYFEMTRNIRENPSEASDIFEDLSESSGGQVTATYRDSRRIFNFAVYAINTADKLNLRNLQRKVGTGSPFLFIPNRDLDPDEVVQQVLWCRFAQPLEFTEVDKPGTILEVANLTLIEFI
jgi:hypothetical protein